MAQPTVIAGTKLLILVGDGASPEVFAEPCGLTTKSFNLTASTNTTLIPDCDDPEAPAWEAKDVNSLAAQVSGSGVMAVESYAKWNDWFMSAAARNAQIKLDNAGLGHYAGSFILTSLKLTGTRGQKVTVDVTLDNDQAVTWVDAA
ncbi:phage tail tube protein [Bradyrhizobium australafricanum]|uniref:phage tail tube protein n=1 Tax=Bradyrhizobium australafricanum TaxID=2821406 RepID=UPI001CE356D2|nr:phage tail tube protein [Bradyrhizobium australafricanum]MCA6098865.1 phage tail protein [Bradyrhizobium australafricanum]